MEQGLECGGGYVKLFSTEMRKRTQRGRRLTNDTPYLLMFGPDVCGHEAKIHLMWNLPSFSTTREMAPSLSLDRDVLDTTTHLYTLRIDPNVRKFHIFVDQQLVREGTFANDLNFTDILTSTEEPVIDMLGFELWTTNGGLAIDNVLLTSNMNLALDFGQQMWKIRAGKELREKAFLKEEPLSFLAQYDAMLRFVLFMTCAISFTHWWMPGLIWGQVETYPSSVGVTEKDLAKE